MDFIVQQAMEETEDIWTKLSRLNEEEWVDLTKTKYERQMEQLHRMESKRFEENWVDAPRCEIYDVVEYTTTELEELMRKCRYKPTKAMLKKYINKNTPLIK